MVEVVAVVMVFGIPITAILTNHFRKLAEMKLQMTQRADDSVVNELRGLKKQMNEMRDTTSRFDVAFDAALQRIESRVGHLEGRVQNLEQTSVSVGSGVNPL